jgi:hypothetical protein
MDKSTTPAGGQLQTETSFGAYSVILRTAEQLPEPIREWLALKRNDVYLELHVPNSVKGSPSRVLKSFRVGAIELADFLRERGLKPKCLVGVTHQNVAKPAQRFLNFTVISGIPEEAVDQEKARRVDQGYEMTQRSQGGAPRGPLCFCYQSFESFLEFTKRLRDSAA